MSVPTLKPCAHCGGNAEFVNSFCGSPELFSLRCNGCGMETARSYTRDECIAAWNQRVTPKHTYAASDTSAALMQLREMLTLTPEIEKQLNHVWNMFEAEYTDIEFRLYEAMEKNRTSGWVDAWKQRPDSKGYYLTYDPDGRIQITGYGTHDENSWNCGPYDGVTHWMPLPEPPGKDA